MPTSLKQNGPALPGRQVEAPVTALIRAILIDLTSIRTVFNAHVHSGVTAGGANTAVSTTLLPALELTA